jgi:hypothetical protein
LLLLSVILLGGGLVAYYAGHLILTRPAGKLPTFMPGYDPGSTMVHSPRYGHDLQAVALSMALLGLVIGALTTVFAVMRSRTAQGQVQRAQRQLGAEGRFVGCTSSGHPIVEVAMQRLIYDRRGRVWRPRIVCPACGRERTTSIIKIVSGADLARLRTMGAWACRDCQQRDIRSLVTDPG